MELWMRRKPSTVTSIHSYKEMLWKHTIIQKITTNLWNTKKYQITKTTMFQGSMLIGGTDQPNDHQKSRTIYSTRRKILHRQNFPTYSRRREKWNWNTDMHSPWVFVFRKFVRKDVLGLKSQFGLSPSIVLKTFFPVYLKGIIASNFFVIRFGEKFAFTKISEVFKYH